MTAAVHTYCRMCVRCRISDALGLIRWHAGEFWRRLHVDIPLGRFGRLFLQPKFQPRDLWIGIYWKPTIERHSEWAGGRWEDWSTVHRVEVWICILPLLPLYASWRPEEGDPEEVPF